MSYTITEVRRIISEIIQDEILGDIVWHMMQTEELGPIIDEKMLQNYMGQIPKRHKVWQTDHPEWNLRKQFTKKWENRPVKVGDFVLARDSHHQKRLWRVKEIISDQSLKVESPQHKQPVDVFVLHWIPVGKYTLSDMAEKYMQNDKPDWRPGDVLPEDYYSF